MSEYRDVDDCPNCGKETEQVFFSNDHERDSTGDRQTCTVCGSYRWFGGDKWFIRNNVKSDDSKDE